MASLWVSFFRWSPGGTSSRGPTFSLPSSPGTNLVGTFLVFRLQLRTAAVGRHSSPAPAGHTSRRCRGHPPSAAPGIYRTIDLSLSFSSSTNMGSALSPLLLTSDYLLPYSPHFGLAPLLLLGLSLLLPTQASAAAAPEWPPVGDRGNGPPGGAGVGAGAGGGGGGATAEKTAVSAGRVGSTAVSAAR